MIAEWNHVLAARGLDWEALVAILVFVILPLLSRLGSGIRERFGEKAGPKTLPGSGNPRGKPSTPIPPQPSAPARSAAQRPAAPSRRTDAAAVPVANKPPPPRQQRRSFGRKAGDRSAPQRPAASPSPTGVPSARVTTTRIQGPSAAAAKIAPAQPSTREGVSSAPVRSAASERLATLYAMGDLRAAVIFSEILAPPLALRDAATWSPPRRID